MNSFEFELKSFTSCRDFSVCAKKESEEGLFGCNDNQRNPNTVFDT